MFVCAPLPQPRSSVVKGKNVTLVASTKQIIVVGMVARTRVGDLEELVGLGGFVDLL
jgi:hypothetical protein